MDDRICKGAQDQREASSAQRYDARRYVSTEDKTVGYIMRLAAVLLPVHISFMRAEMTLA